MGGAGDRGGIDAASGEPGGNIGNLLWRKRWARALDGGEGGAELEMGADVAIGWDVFEDFEDDITAENDKIVDWYE